MAETIVYLEQNAAESFQPQILITLTLLAQLAETGAQAPSPEVLQRYELALAIIIGLLAAFICSQRDRKAQRGADEDRYSERP